MKSMMASMKISQPENEEQDQPPPPPEKKVQSGQVRQQRRGSTKDLNNQRYESDIVMTLGLRGSFAKKMQVQK